jgi:large subunit ribosomal protein L21
MYAILSHGGRQYRVSAGDRLLVDRIEAEVGSVVALEPILLTGGDGTTALGRDLDGMRVAVTVVAHRRGRKLRIFKYKAKKRSRKMAGYRSNLTELRVESILAKGARLPRATAPAGTGSAEPVEEKPRAAARATRASTTPKSRTDATPSATARTATAGKAGAVAEQPLRSTAKRVSAKDAASATAGGSLPAPADSVAAEGGPSKSRAAKPPAAGRAAKVPPKTAKRGATTKDKETRDGA